MPLTRRWLRCGGALTAVIDPVALVRDPDGSVRRFVTDPRPIGSRPRPPRRDPASPSSLDFAREVAPVALAGSSDSLAAVTPTRALGDRPAGVHRWSATRHLTRILYAVAAFAALAGCDEIVDVENLAPQIEAVGWCTADARTFLVLRLIDREQDSIDLTLRAASCGGCAIETGGAGDGLRGLQSASGEPGALHRIEWRDAGALSGELDFEVQAIDAAGERPAEQLVFSPLPACPG